MPDQQVHYSASFQRGATPSARFKTLLIIGATSCPQALCFGGLQYDAASSGSQAVQKSTLLFRCFCDSCKSLPSDAAATDTPPWFSSGHKLTKHQAGLGEPQELANPH